MAKCICLWFVALTTFTLAGCGTVREKTAPCKRPAELTSYTTDPRRACDAMRTVTDPAAAFALLGVTDTN